MVVVARSTSITIATEASSGSPGVKATSILTPPVLPQRSAAWAAASRAIGTRNGEHDT